MSQRSQRIFAGRADKFNWGFTSDMMRFILGLNVNLGTSLGISDLDTEGRTEPSMQSFGNARGFNETAATATHNTHNLLVHTYTWIGESNG